MKKLMFATALGVSVVGFGATAAPVTYNATSFEEYTANSSILSDKGDTQSPAYFCYRDGDADGSLVKTFGGDNLATPSITRPFYYATATPNANYLELSTEGGILWRSINAIQGSANDYDLGTAQAVASDGLYLDTLVQFTPTEDGGAPELDSADKLAIWLNVDSSATPPVTNLMVKAGFVDDNGTATTQTPTTYTLTTASPVVPGQWYRLTVKTIADVTQQVAKNPEAYPSGYMGFEIYLDGVLLAATAPAFGQGFIDLATDAGEFGWLDQTDDASLITYLQSGTVFPALGLPTTTYTLQGVGFKGSGALDDIVWTEEDPFANAGGDDYKVVIDGNDVVVTPTQADLETIGQALPGLNVNDPTAVNAALATPIEGSGGIPAWQALFLGLAPTTNDLETIKIDSIKLENGKILIEMAEGLTLKTGRGVSILFKVFASNDLTTWGESPIVTATDTTEIPEITPALGETKKFYKVVVEFAASSAQN